MSAVVSLLSATLIGVEAYPISVEVSATTSLPGIKTVGLPDKAMREGENRVWLALRSSALLGERPSAVVNLAPAELRKTGSAFELPIALGLLVVREKLGAERIAGLMVVGELSLKGEVKPVRGVLSMAVLARARGVRGLVVPLANAREAAAIRGVRVHAVETLRGLVEALGEGPGLPAWSSLSEREDATRTNDLDLAEVRGQAQARRAAEVAAAGGHNLLFVGPPGSGKTMIARRMNGILPPLLPEEAIETTQVHSAAGLLAPGSGLIKRRAFRAPHHSISSAGLIGGYVPPRPGEVSLAHNGVLFLDELAEFARASLEALREPLEEGEVRIVRGGVRARFPARVILVGATNPCPCGYLGDPVRPCACSLGSVMRYRRGLSGPLLDRIDLHIDVPRPRPEELAGERPAEGSAEVAARVARARELQVARLQSHGARTNAQLGERAVRELVPLAAAVSRQLERAVETLGLSPRAYVRILRVARTIADLAGEREVALPHILEAVQYRTLDRRPS